MNNQLQNPYTSPESRTILQRDIELGNKTYYAEENLLVIQDGTELPKLCIITGEHIPEATYKKKNLRYANPAWGILLFAGILPYIIFYYFFTKKATFTYTISDKYKYHRLKILLFCFGITLFGLCGLAYLTFTDALFIENGLFYIVSIIATLLGILYAGYNCSSFRVEKYASGRFHISGAGSIFLATIAQDNP